MVCAAVDYFRFDTQEDHNVVDGYHGPQFIHAVTLLKSADARDGVPLEEAKGSVIEKLRASETAIAADSKAIAVVSRLIGVVESLTDERVASWAYGSKQL